MGGVVIRGGRGGSGETLLTTGGSIVIAQAALPGSLDMEAEGTLDYFSMGNTATDPLRSIAAGTVHAPTYGGHMQVSADWVHASGTSQSAYTSGLPRTTGLHDLATVPFAAQTAARFISTPTAGITHFGIRFRVPAARQVRVLRVYADHWSCVATLAASLTDGSAPDASDTINTGAGAGAARKWTVTYNSAAGGDICVSLLVTTNHGSTPNIGFLAATLASV